MSKLLAGVKIGKVIKKTCSHVAGYVVEILSQLLMKVINNAKFYLKLGKAESEVLTYKWCVFGHRQHVTNNCRKYGDG